MRVNWASRPRPELFVLNKAHPGPLPIALNPHLPTGHPLEQKPPSITLKRIWISQKFTTCKIQRGKKLQSEEVSKKNEICRSLKTGNRKGGKQEDCEKSHGKIEMRETKKDKERKGTVRVETRHN